MLLKNFDCVVPVLLRVFWI